MLGFGVSMWNAAMRALAAAVPPSGDLLSLDADTLSLDADSLTLE